MVKLDQSGDNVRPVAAKDITVVRQHFERGEMYWFAPAEAGANGTIFVLMNAIDQWWRGEDDWDGVYKPTDIPPPGLITPGGGFGKMWAWMDFSDELGFAMSGEYVTDDGYYTARGDGWELLIGDCVIELPADKQWTPPEPEPDPEPEPTPTPTPTPIPVPALTLGWWVWLTGLEMAVNLDHVIWIGADRLRIGPHDIVLSLPPATATALRAYVKARCVEVI